MTAPCVAATRAMSDTCDLYRRMSMVVLTPQQKTKLRRLQAQTNALHRTVLSFAERRREVNARLIAIDKQVGMETSRGRAIPADMQADIDAMKEPLRQELDLLAREEARVAA